MEKKIREEILGDKADEIREEIWQKERYAELILEVLIIALKQ